MERKVELKIRSLNISHLKLLRLLCQWESKVATPQQMEELLGTKIKLGGILGSLTRQKIDGESLILKCGQEEPGKTYRWQLNERLVDRQELLELLVKMNITI